MCKEELETIEEVMSHGNICPETYRQTTFAGDSQKEVPEKVINSVESTLNQRGKEYGKFRDLSRIAQDMKFYLRCCHKWCELTADQQEALDMIASKTARILNGNPNNVDSWHDIAGYATLIADRLRGNSR
jgi:hypothetical protein